MVNRGKWEGRSRKKGKHTIDKETVERDHRGVQHTGYMLKSEASLTGFAVSPWITRTLQRCENFTCAHVCFQRVFPPTFPRHSVYFFPLFARGLIPRLIAHAEQTVFFFYYFIHVRIVCFVSMKLPSLSVDSSCGGRKIQRNCRIARIRIEPNAPKFSIRKNLDIPRYRNTILAWIKKLCYPIICIHKNGASNYNYFTVQL